MVKFNSVEWNFSKTAIIFSVNEPNWIASFASSLLSSANPSRNYIIHGHKEEAKKQRKVLFIKLKWEFP